MKNSSNKFRRKNDKEYDANSDIVYYSKNKNFHEVDGAMEIADISS